MEKCFVVLAGGRPVHDGVLSYEEAILLWERWSFLMSGVLMEEVSCDVVQ